LQFQ
jgi:hypothetical protein